MTLLSPIWLLLLPLLVYFAIKLHRQTDDDWDKVISKPILELLREQKPRRSRSFLAWVIIGLIVVALSAPALIDQSKESAQIHARPLILILDVSASMDQGDIARSRLEAAKAHILSLVKNSEPRPVALIVFSGDAFLLQPFSLDLTFLEQITGAVTTDTIELEGSALHRSLELTQQLISENQIFQAELTILSDGGQVETRSLALTTQLAEDGHRVNVVMTGLETTSAPHRPETERLRELAKLGRGNFSQLTALGSIDQQLAKPRAFLFPEQATVDMNLSSGFMHLVSHWIILVCLPLVLLLFKRGGES